MLVWSRGSQGFRSHVCGPRCCASTSTHVSKDSNNCHRDTKRHSTQLSTRTHTWDTLHAIQTGGATQVSKSNIIYLVSSFFMSDTAMYVQSVSQSKQSCQAIGETDHAESSIRTRSRLGTIAQVGGFWADSPSVSVIWMDFDMDGIFIAT